jgi:hypothetical protein
MSSAGKSRATLYALLIEAAGANVAGPGAA